MKYTVFIVLALCALAAAESKVAVLDESNFDSTIADNKQVLVEFFAPWCGHCKALAPEYDEASLTLDGKDAGIVASVDCTEHRDLCNKYEVRGFPTLKLFRPDGSHSEYDSARKADAIVKFMVKQSQPPVAELADAAAVEAFAADESVKVVAFVNDEDLAAYTQVAQALRNDYSFGVVKGDAAAAAAYKVTVPGVLVLRDFDEGNVVFDGSFTDNLADDLTAFVKAQSFPLVGTIGPENYSKYLDRGFNFLWIFVDLENAEQTAMIENVITPLAKEYRTELSFVKLDGVKWAEHGKSFGLSGTTPGVVIEDRQKSKKFIFNEADEITTETFGAYLAGYKAGTLVANVKSEPIPESNDGPVTVVVGKTFEDIVFDTSKDVLVEFYAPWCGHCKTLAPKYEELGELFKDNENVVIAKIDATANDSPAEVQGFPTLILYTAGDNTKVEYSGARAVEDMAAFIKEKGTAGAATEKAAGHEEL